MKFIGLNYRTQTVSREFDSNYWHATTAIRCQLSADIDQLLVDVFVLTFIEVSKKAADGVRSIYRNPLSRVGAVGLYTVI
jgi:hypothetical protein